MERRDLLRRCTAAVVGSTVGLAGCSGSDDDGNDEQTEAGSVAENSVDGLEIVGLTGETGDDDYTATVTVRNTVSQTTDIFNYNYDLILYDEDESEIMGGVTGTVPTGPTEIGPDEEGMIDLNRGTEETNAEVAMFEILLNCDAPFADGVYCE